MPSTSESPMSAARLAAEAAFAPPQARSAPSNEPLVIVKRARVLAQAGPSLVAQTAGPARQAEAIEDRDKPPRVFRVHKPSDPTECPPADPGQPARRRRRKPPEQRPGAVVLRVVQTPADAPSTRAADPQGADRPDRWPRYATIEALAAVGPVLDAIARAQAFQFIDERYALEWERLSRKAERLREDLQSMQL